MGKNKTGKNPCKISVKISAPTRFGYFLSQKRIFLGTRWHTCAKSCAKNGLFQAK